MQTNNYYYDLDSVYQSVYVQKWINTKLFHEPILLIWHAQIVYVYTR